MAATRDLHAGKADRSTRARKVDAAAGIAVWILCALPLALLAFDTATGRIGADPIREMTHRTGWWALTLLLATLAVSPLRRISGWNSLIRFRKMLGLFAFFYASLHVLIYFGLDQMFGLSYIVEDIISRPYITVGFAAWVLLIPLAVTSTRGWMRRLGKRWQLLHRLIYVAAALGVVHFFWSMKADTREPLIFAGLLAALLVLRIPAVSRAIAQAVHRPAHSRQKGR